MPLSIPPGWTLPLASQAPKMVLVTVNTHGRDPSDPDKPHLALQPDSYTFCSHETVEVTDTRSGRTKPFWPWLQNWPTVTYSFAPEDRRAEISNTSLSVLADAGLTAALRDVGGEQRATVRIDLWAKGIPLKNVFPLTAGIVTGMSDGERRAGPLTLTMTDGDPERQVQYPNDAMSLSEFPGAPYTVIENEYVPIIVGPFPQRHHCPQMDDTRRRFLIAGHALTQKPTAVQKGGTTVTSGWQVLPGKTATKQRDITYIEFTAKVDEISAGVTDEVTCSGGVGRVDKNIVALLCEIAGFRLSRRAQALLPQFDRDFPLSLEFSSPANVLDLLRQRILPQTGYVAYFRRNELDLIPLLGTVGETRLGVGKGLLFRVPGQDGSTPLSSVFNVIEVRCGRDMFASSSSPVPLIRIRRDYNEGSPDIRALLDKSQASAWGRRELPDAGKNFNDLAVLIDSNGNPTSCPGGQRIADLLARLHAFPHRTFSYATTWPMGMSVDLNDRVLLTDPDENLADEPTRVVQVAYGPTGTTVQFQTEDAGLS